jgi:hypothetical protein
MTVNGLKEAPPETPTQRDRHDEILLARNNAPILALNIDSSSLKVGVSPT